MIQEYDLGILDAEQALSLDPTNTTSIYRKAKCLFGLCKYEDSLALLEQVFQKLQTSEVESMIAKTKLFVSQSEGNYDLFALMEQCEQNPFQRFDVAEYTSSKLTIKDTMSIGIGVYTTSPIEFGELLVLSKALHVVFPKEKPPSFDFNFLKKTMNTQERTYLVGELSSMCVEQSGLLKKLYTLYDGSSKRKDYEGINLDRIDKVVHYNSFGIGIEFSEEQYTEKGSGLFYIPSFFNHSDQPNCSYNFLGDLMLIRATKNIKADEQLFISYVPLLLQEERDNILRKYWGIKIDRPIIPYEIEKLKADVKYFEKIHQETISIFEANQQKGIHDTPKIPATQMVAKIKYWESKLGFGHINLIHIYKHVGQTFHLSNYFQQALEYFEKLIKLLKRYNPTRYEFAIQYCICALNNVKQDKVSDLFDDAINAARQMIICSWGKSDSRFYDKLMKPLEPFLEGFVLSSLNDLKFDE